jgi:hypothetical protein
MHFNKKILSAVGLISGVVLFASMTAIQQPQQREEPKLKNIKVLPKSMTYHQVDQLMDEWASALGVKCNFCHAQDKASDEKPEKTMARHMYQMAAKINKKYFKAEKDSLGAVMESSVNCYTCHHGVAHVEISLRANRPRPTGQGGGPGGQRGQGGPGGAPGGSGPQGATNGGPGTPPTADKKP